MANTTQNRILGGRTKGYGWAATLELLSLPVIANNRQGSEMNLCHSCASVHELDGVCNSRHGDVSPLAFYTPATAMGNGNL